MGYNATVVVHVDALHHIKTDPKFGEKLASAVSSVSMRDSKMVDVSAGCHCNAAEVIETHHADQVVVVAVGGNMGESLGYAGSWKLIGSKSDEDKVTMLKILADKYGYDLHKKRQKD